MRQNQRGFTITEILIAIGIISFVTLLASSMINGLVNLRRVTETDVEVSNYIHSLSGWLRSSKTFSIAGFDPNFNPATSCTRTFYGVTLPEETTDGVWNGVGITIPLNVDNTSWKYSGPGTNNLSGSNVLTSGIQLSRDIRIATGDGLQARLRKLTSVSQGDQLLKANSSLTTRRVMQIRLKLQTQHPTPNGALISQNVRDVFFETLVETNGTQVLSCIPDISLRESCRIQGGIFDEVRGTCAPQNFCENSGFFVVYACAGTMGSAPCDKFVLQGDTAKANNPFTGAQSCPPGAVATKISEADIGDGYLEEYYSCMRCN